MNLVHVRTLFPVHLDADEVAVQHLGDTFVLIGILLHHVAPVTGGIAYGEQDDFVFGPGGLKGFGAPGIPVDRIVRVLEKIGAGLEDEPVDETRGAA